MPFQVDHWVVFWTSSPLSPRMDCLPFHGLQKNIPCHSHSDLGMRGGRSSCGLRGWAWMPGASCTKRLPVLGQKRKARVKLDTPQRRPKLRWRSGLKPTGMYEKPQGFNPGNFFSVLVPVKNEDLWKLILKNFNIFGKTWKWFLNTFTTCFIRKWLWKFPPKNKIICSNQKMHIHFQIWFVWKYLFIITYPQCMKKKPFGTATNSKKIQKK